jgi:hypothetical protein
MAGGSVKRAGCRRCGVGVRVWSGERTMACTSCGAEVVCCGAQCADGALCSFVPLDGGRCYRHTDAAVAARRRRDARARLDQHRHCTTPGGLAPNDREDRAVVEWARAGGLESFAAFAARDLSTLLAFAEAPSP